MSQFGQCILVVDDTPAVCDLLREMLSKRYDVTAVGSASDARRELSAQPFAAIISDYMMPETNGIELLAEVAQKHPKTARILISAAFDDQLRERALVEAGAHRVLAKPIRMIELQEALTSVLQEVAQEQSVNDTQAPELWLEERPRLLRSIRAELRRAARHRHSASLLWLSLEHAAGTVADVDLAQIVSEAWQDARFRGRISDTIGRYSKDEIALLLPETHKSGGEIKATRIREALDDLFGGTLADRALSLHVGVACYPDDARTEEALLECAARHCA